MNEKNLIPMNKRTKSEQREYTKKGGIRSGEVRRQRKAMKEQMEMLLSLPYKKQSEIEELGIDKENIDNQMAIIVAMYKKALNGDVQAFNTIREVTQDNQNPNSESRVQIINDLPEEDENES